MADQNVNININEFDRTPQGESQTFGPEGGPPTGSGNSPNPNAHAPRQAPPEPPPAPEDPDSTTGQLQSLTGQVVNQAVVPIMETIFGRNPITGAAKTVMQYGADYLPALAEALGMGGQAATTAGTAGAAATGAAGALAAVAPPAIAIAGAVVAVGALTAAFLYAKDQLLSAADEVAMFNGKIATAKAMQENQALFDKIDRANTLQDEFSTMINLQTEANHQWSRIETEVMRAISPMINEGISQMGAGFELVNELLLAAKPLIDLQIFAFQGLAKIDTPIEVLRDIARNINDWLGLQREQKQEDPLAMAERLLNANLARVRAGQLPQNGGLGG